VSGKTGDDAVGSSASDNVVSAGAAGGKGEDSDEDIDTGINVNSPSDQVDTDTQTRPEQGREVLQSNTTTTNEKKKRAGLSDAKQAVSTSNKPAAKASAKKPTPEKKNVTPTPASSYEENTSNAPPPLPSREPVMLTPSDINRLVSEKDRRIQQCYEMAMIQSPDLEGTMVLHIGVAGEDVQAKVIRNDLSPGLANCVVRVMKSLVPPPNTGELVEIEKSYDFTLKK
jgi:hypothetical protein